jgi:hypothetical protein
LSNAADSFCNDILLGVAQQPPPEFLVSSVSRSWREANSFCGDWGGSLAAITSEKEELLFSAQLKNNQTYWIGLHKKKGKYSWTDDSLTEYS